jgi:hypothetical protein
LPATQLSQIIGVTLLAMHSWWLTGWRVAMNDLDDTLTAIAAVATLLIMFAVAWWWLPQKWQACQKLYDNRPAQVFCFGAK